MLPYWNLTLTLDPASPSTAEEFAEHAVARAMWIYISPVILVTGTIGNILALIVLRRSALKHSTSSLYLQFVSVADTCVLYFGLLALWIKELWVDITTLHAVPCKLRNFLFYTSADVAVWLVVGFTLDRFIAVCMPLRRKILCTRKKAKFCSVFLIALGIGKNAHLFWTRTIVEVTPGVYQCTNPTADYRYFNKFIRPWIVLVLSTVGPFIAVTFFNCAIIYFLWKTTKKRAQITADNSFEKNTRHMTVMCLGVSCSFLILLMPSIVILIGRPYWRPTLSAKAKYQLARAFGNLFVYLHHSCNFFLYCITGKKFRTELAAMIFKLNKIGTDSANNSSETAGDGTKQTTPGLGRRNVLLYPNSHVRFKTPSPERRSQRGLASHIEINNGPVLGPSTSYTNV